MAARVGEGFKEGAAISNTVSVTGGGLDAIDAYIENEYGIDLYKNIERVGGSQIYKHNEYGKISITPLPSLPNGRLLMFDRADENGIYKTQIFYAPDNEFADGYIHVQYDWDVEHWKHEGDVWYGFIQATVLKRAIKRFLRWVIRNMR